MYATKNPDGEVANNKNEIVKVVEDFYRDLYSSNEQPRTEVNAVIRDVPNTTVVEVKKKHTHKGMERGKTEGFSVEMLEKS